MEKDTSSLPSSTPPPLFYDDEFMLDGLAQIDLTEIHVTRHD